MSKITKALYTTKLTAALTELDNEGSWTAVNTLVDDTLCVYFPNIETRSDLVLFVRSLNLEDEQAGRLFGLLSRGLTDLNTANSFWED